MRSFVLKNALSRANQDFKFIILYCFEQIVCTGQRKTNARVGVICHSNLTLELFLYKRINKKIGKTSRKSISGQNLKLFSAISLSFLDKDWWSINIWIGSGYFLCDFMMRLWLFWRLLSPTFFIELEYVSGKKYELNGLCSSYKMYLAYLVILKSQKMQKFKNFEKM